MFKFLIKLLKQSILYLGVIPWLYDMLSAYFEFDNFQFPKWFIIIFAILSFLYASFKVYEEEHKIREELEKKLNGPTDYKVTAILTPIDFEVNKELKHIDENKDKAAEKLKELKPLLVEKSPVSDGSIVIATLNNNLKSLGFELNKSQEQYHKELTHYKTKLEYYIKNSENYKIQLQETISEWQKEYYFIKFVIENTGIKSDTDIQIHISCNDKSIVFKKIEFVKYGIDIFTLVPLLPQEPEKPKMVSSSFTGLTPSTASILKNNMTAALSGITPPNAFRKWIEIEDKKCSVTIRDLHVGGKVDIFNTSMIVKTNINAPKFEVTIKSKESTRILHPTVNVDFKEVSVSLFQKVAEEN